jgi:hypothetical protein
VFKTSISAKKFISLLLLGNTDKGSMKNRFVWAFNKKSTWKLPRCCHCSKPVFLQFSQVTFVRIFGNCFLNCGKDVCAKGLSLSQYFPLFLRYTSVSLSLWRSLYISFFSFVISPSQSLSLKVYQYLLSLSLSRQNLFFNS